MLPHRPAGCILGAGVVFLYTVQGQRLRGGTGGIVPLKKLGEGDRSAFIPPQYLENVLQIYNVKTNNNEKEDETHVMRDRHTSIILFHCLD